jgi:hypothetical protein
MKVNKCEQNIDKWEQNIDQQKQMTVLASLAASGAFIVFTAAAFLPGIGMLAALGIGDTHLATELELITRRSHWWDDRGGSYRGWQG